jgi:beta-lactamase-like protein
MARLKEGPQTIPQMVAKNYADTPAHLHAAAGRSMLAHLIQMAKDGRVKTEDGQARIDSVYRL